LPRRRQGGRGNSDGRHSCCIELTTIRTRRDRFGGTDERCPRQPGSRRKGRSRRRFLAPAEPGRALSAPLVGFGRGAALAAARGRDDQAHGAEADSARMPAVVGAACLSTSGPRAGRTPAGTVAPTALTSGRVDPYVCASGLTRGRTIASVASERCCSLDRSH